jgi:hypothetical protein
MLALPAAIVAPCLEALRRARKLVTIIIISSPVRGKLGRVGSPVGVWAFVANFALRR